LLTLGTVLTTLDPLNMSFGIQTKLPAVRKARKGFNTCIDPKVPTGFPFLTGLDFESKLNPGSSDHIGVEPFSTDSQSVEVLMESDREIEGDLGADTPEHQPTVEFRSILRDFQPGNHG
jgi:hypothetical protein